MKRATNGKFEAWFVFITLNINEDISTKFLIDILV